MVTKSKLLRSAPIVVHITMDTVEALVPRQGSSTSAQSAGQTGRRLVRFKHEFGFGASMATYVAAKLRAEGVKPQPIVLAIASDLVHAKKVEIPALGAKELNGVISRRLAGLMEVDPRDVTFVGLALDGEDVDERRWLLAGVQRTPLFEAQREFRKQGFTVKHAVSARIAPFISGRISRESQEGAATIVVIFEADHCAIGVLSEGRLVHTTALQGGARRHLEEPQTARAFSQELRGIDAFWRRASRGESVGAVVLCGMGWADVSRFEPMVTSALGQVRVKALDVQEFPVARSAEHGDGSIEALDLAEERARIDVLSTMLSPRMRVLDFAVELRPRARTISAIAVASLAMFGSMAFAVRQKLHSQAVQIHSESTAVASTSADLGELETLSSSVESVESMVREAAKQIDSVGTMGLAVQDLVTGVFMACHGDAEILSILASSSSSSDMGENTLRVRGVVEDAPGRTAQVLQRLKARLEAVPGVVSVEVANPQVGAGGGSETLDLGTEKSKVMNFSAALTLESSASNSDTGEEEVLAPQGADGPMGGMGA